MRIIRDPDWRTLAAWLWRLPLVAVAAAIFLAIAIAAIKRYDWLILRYYGHCVPCLLTLAATIGCGRRALQAAACATVALAPFVSWYVLSDAPSTYFTVSALLWACAVIWLMFEMLQVIRLAAEDAQCGWLVKMSHHAGLSFTYSLIVPTGAFLLANSFVFGMPWHMEFWHLIIAALHTTPKYLIPIVWNAFVFLEISCAAILAAHQAVRRQFAQTDSIPCPQQENNENTP